METWVIVSLAIPVLFLVQHLAGFNMAVLTSLDYAGDGVSDQIILPDSFPHEFLHAEEPKPLSERLSAFKDWLMSNGFDVSSLPASIEPTPQGLALIATKPLKKNSLVFSFPQRLMITPDTVDRSEIGDILRSTGISTPSDIKLAMFLLVERAVGPSSFWNAYIDMLPTLGDGRADSLPIYLTEEETMLLESVGPSVAKTLKERRDKVALMLKFVEDLKQAASFPHWHAFEKESVQWALSMVWSRCLYISDSIDRALVPFVDMMNHAHNITTNEVYFLHEGDESHHDYIYYAPYNLGNKWEFMLSYGQKPNSELYLSYGFTLKDNPQDRVVFDVKMNRNDELRAQKTLMIKERGIRPDECFLDFHGRPSESLVTAIHIARLEEPSQAMDRATVLEDIKEMAINKRSQVEAKCELALKLQFDSYTFRQFLREHCRSTQSILSKFIDTQEP